MKLLVFEPYYSGHRLVYLSHMIPEFQRLGTNVTLLTSAATLDSEQFKTHLKGRLDKVVFDLNDPRLGTAGTRGNARALIDGIRRHRPDHLIVPVGDGLSQALGTMGPINRCGAPGMESEVLHFQGGFGYAIRGHLDRLRRFLTPRLVYRVGWDRVHHLDPEQLNGFRVRNGADDRYHVMPDPVEPVGNVSKTRAREVLGIPDDATVVTCVGGLNVRKGVDILIRAFRDSISQAPTNSLLFVAGKTDSRVRAELESSTELRRGRRIIWINRHLSNEEFALSFPASDVVACLYRRHYGSSSLIIRAAAYGRPVLSSEFGWMGRTTRQFNLGWTVDESDQEMVVARLIQSMAQCAELHPTPAAKRFVAYHTIPNFLAHWTARLRQRLDMAPAKELIHWESVATESTS